MEYRQNLINWLKNTSGESFPDCIEQFEIQPSLYREDKTYRGVCQCEKAGLRHIYVIKHIPTGINYDIGSSCINVFYDHLDKIQSEKARQNVINMLKFVSQNESQIRIKQGKGTCIVCSKPTVGNNTLKASTNWYYYCKECVNLNKKRKCITCEDFFYYIDKPLYMKQCPNCYFDCNNYVK